MRHCDIVELRRCGGAHQPAEGSAGGDACARLEALRLDRGVDGERRREAAQRVVLVPAWSTAAWWSPWWPAMAPPRRPLCLTVRSCVEPGSPKVQMITTPLSSRMNCRSSPPPSSMHRCAAAMHACMHATQRNARKTRMSTTGGMHPCTRRWVVHLLRRLRRCTRLHCGEARSARQQRRLETHHLRWTVTNAAKVCRPGCGLAPRPRPLGGI